MVLDECRRVLRRGRSGAAPLAFLAGGLRIFANIAVARLRGERGTPFFDGATGAPVREPQVLSLLERRSLV